MDEAIKCVVIGDGSVGKTSLLISHFQKAFPTDYIPTVFELFDNVPNMVINNKQYILCTWDTGGGEDYHLLRPLCYPKTNVFLICYSIGNERSFNNVFNYWFPEVKTYMPDTPIVLVGLKKDLRDDNILKFDDDDHPNFITYEQGKSMANDIGAVSFYECSAKKLYGLDDLFETLVIIGANLPKKKKQKSKSNKNCTIF